MQTPIYHVISEPAPYATPVFVALSATPYDADIVARWSLHGGEETVYLVNDWRPGITRVYFENGPVPGSAEHHWMLDEQRRLQEQAQTATQTELPQPAAPTTEPGEPDPNELIPNEEQQQMIDAFGGGHWENDGDGKPLFIFPTQ